MLTPLRIEIIRTSASPRRIPAPRLVRRPVDTTRLKAGWRSEIYAALLRLEERAEQSRDALRSNDDAAAAAIGHDLTLRAMSLSRVLDRLRTTP